MSMSAISVCRNSFSFTICVEYSQLYTHIQQSTAIRSSRYLRKGWCKCKAQIDVAYKIKFIVKLCTFCAKVQFLNEVKYWEHEHFTPYNGITHARQQQQQHQQTLTPKNKRKEWKSTHKHTIFWLTTHTYELKSDGIECNSMLRNVWIELKLSLMYFSFQFSKPLIMDFAIYFISSYSWLGVFVVVLLSSSVNTFLVGHISSCLISLPTPFGFFSRLKKKKLVQI